MVKREGDDDTYDILSILFIMWFVGLYFVFVQRKLIIFLIRRNDDTSIFKVGIEISLSACYYTCSTEISLFDIFVPFWN